MSRSLRLTLAIASLALAGRGVLGCADGIVTPPASSTHDDASLDGGATDALETDAASDARSTAQICSVDGWCYTRLPSAGSFDAAGIVPDPSGVRFALSSVWVAPDRRAWAVSRAGHVLRWNGTEWSVVLVAGAALRSVWGASATDVWVAGDTGLLLHGTGATAESLTFEPVAIASAQTITRVWGTSATDVWVIADRAYHLTADTLGSATPFVEVPLPSNYGDAASFVRPTAVWGTASDTWFAGTESTFCAPPSCTNATQLFAARRRVGAGGVTWDTVPMAIADATKVVGGTSTSSGVQVLAVATRLFDTAFAARIADDASKLDPKHGAVTVAGAHAWSFQVAETFGQPTGIWGREDDDVFLVGEWGVVRRFDGSDWQIARVARTPVSPLVSHLNAVDGVDSAGEREMWIVGEDVALRRAVKP